MSEELVLGLGSFRKLLYEVERDRSPVERFYDETWLAQEMVRCYKLDLLCWYIVYGMTRAGKSTYAITSLVKAIEKLGQTENWNFTDEGAFWDFLDKRIVFDVDKILEYFETARERRQTEGRKDIGVIFDDAGVHLHAYKAFHERKFTERISALLQVAGVYTANIIITTPSPDFVLRMIREMDNMKLVLVNRQTENMSIATIYRLRFYPPRKIGVKKMIREEFKLNMRFFNEYTVKRSTYTDQQIAMLRKYIGKEKSREIGEEIKRMTRNICRGG
jgi:hypothetical protein